MIAASKANIAEMNQFLPILLNLFVEKI